MSEEAFDAVREEQVRAHSKTMSSPPAWLLDVDGVINAVTHESPLGSWDDYRQVIVDGLSVCYSPSVVAFINEVHTAGLAQVFWLTTWEEDAQTQLAPALGLENFPLAGKDPYAGELTFGQTWWKFEIAKELYEQDPDRAVLWTDDDLVVEPLASSWARIVGLGVAPRSHLGLTPQDLRTIAEFLRAGQ